MKIRYYTDPVTGQPHIYNHGVAEEEAEEILTNSGEDRPGAEGSRVALGKTSGGRYLRVIYIHDDEPGSIFVITAYNLSGKPLKAFLRRRRRKK